MADVVEYILILNDKFSRKAKNANKAASVLKSTMKALVPVAGVAGMGMAFGKTVQVASQFEKQMAEVAAISQATRSQFLALESQAEGLGATTAFSAKQASEAMTFLSMAGFKVNDTMKAMPGVLDLAAAGSVDLAFAADTASNVLTQFGLAAEEMGRVNDVIVSTTSKANVNVNQLAEGLKYTGTTAKILKMPLEETAAALGVLGNAGLQGSMGGTSLNFALLEMSRSSSKVSKDLAKLGVQTKGADGNFVGLTNILSQFEEKGIGAGKVLDIFGARAGRAMGTLVEAGADAVAELTDLNKESEGLAKRIAKLKLDNLAGDMTIFKSATQGAAISLGKRMNPAMRSSIQFATKLVSGFNDLVKVPLSDTLRKDKFEFNSLINTLQRAESSVDAKKIAVAKLNEKYKEYVGELITEKTTEKELTEIRKRGNDELLKRIRIQARKELIEEEEKKANEFITKVIELEDVISTYQEKLKTASKQKGYSVDLTGNIVETRSDFERYHSSIRGLQNRIDNLNAKAQKFADNARRMIEAGGVEITDEDDEDDGGNGGNGGTDTEVTTKTDKATDNLLTKITSAAPKVFNINIENLIDDFTIKTENIKESTPQVKEMIMRTVLESLNDAQLNYK